MIQHDIIVVKPPATPVVPYQQSNWYNNTPVATRRYPNIESQEQLNKWLLETPYAVGDYVTYSRMPIYEANLPHAVFMVMDRVRDFNILVSQTYAPYHHKLLQLQTLESFDGHTVLDWKDIHNLRKLSENEITTVVRPYLDRVRNRSQP